MSRLLRQREEISAETLLKAYAAGIFPMSEGAEDPNLFWVEPAARGVIPLDGLIVSRRLARTVRSDRFEVVVDRDFEAVIDGCAAPGPGRSTTWINRRIRTLYGELFRIGHAHTVEVYEDGELVGGLYGVDLGAAFFGESMFHRKTDASKVALVHLVARLRLGGYRLLDTQFVTDHLASLGCIEVPRKAYRAKLDEALRDRASFCALPERIRGEDALQMLGLVPKENGRP